MIDFSQATYQAILQNMLSLVPDTFDKRDGSPIPTALGPAAFVLEGFFLSLNQVQQQAFIQTAVGDSLDLLGAVAGLKRDQASAAVRLGVFNMDVPIGCRFSTMSGSNSINFSVTATAMVTEPQPGDYYYQLTAETPGSIGNEYTGPILPITVIPGLTSAQITSIMIPGDDTETDDAFRQRIITALNEKPFGGNIASYRTAITDIDGVGAVQVYPTWNGGGTVLCSVLGSNWLPASEELVENVQRAIDPPPSQGQGLGMAPIGAQVTITAPTEVAIQVTATLELSPGYAIGQVQQPVEEAIEAYLLTIRQAWATNISPSGVEYAANVYLSRITAAIVSVTGVVNATGVQLNGGTSDLVLTETGTVQQVPVIGTVTLHE